MVLTWKVIDEGVWECVESGDILWLVEDYIVIECRIPSWSLLVLQKGNRMQDAQFIGAYPSKKLANKIATALMKNLATKQEIKRLVEISTCAQDSLSS